MAVAIVGLVIALIAILVSRRLFRSEGVSAVGQVEIYCDECSEINWESGLIDRLGLCIACEADLTEFMKFAD